MDDCIADLRGFPASSGFPEGDQEYHREIKGHLSLVERWIKEHHAAITSKAEYIISQLDPGIHTASYVTILEATIMSDPKSLTSRRVLLNAILQFLVSFDQRQIRYVGAATRHVMEHILTDKVFSPAITVDAIATALLRLDPSGSILTSTQCLLANFAYSSGCIEQARPVIEKPIIFFPDSNQQLKFICSLSLAPSSYINPSTGLTKALTSTNVLEYELTCGMIHIQERNWAAAMDSLERCVSHPTDDLAVSAIMLQAFYKWALVSLIHHGQMIALPGPQTTAVTLAYESLGETYIALDGFFAEEDATGLREHRKREKAKFSADGNLRLVDEVIASFQKWQIVKLGDLYSRISIREVRLLTQSAVTGASLATDAEVEALISDMIDAKMIDARLETPPGEPSRLAFLQDAGTLSEKEFSRKLLAAAQETEVLSELSKAANAGLGRNSGYVKYMVRDKKRRDKEGPEGRGGMDIMDFESHLDDEDLMLDLGGRA